MKNFPVYVAAAALATVGLGVCAYKVQTLGLPLAPQDQATVWTIEARATFRASGGPARVELAVPYKAPGFDLLDEDFISANFGVSNEVDGATRQAMWTVRRAKGSQVLYYRATTYESGNQRQHADPFPGFPQVPEFEEPLKSAVTALLDQVRNESADIETFTRQLIIRLNEDRANPVVEMLRNRSQTAGDRARQIVQTLAGARIPARVLWGIELVDGVRDAQLVPWLEVHDEKRWIAFDPNTGKSGFPPRFFVWHIGDVPLIYVDGGRNAEVQFSVAQGYRDVVTIAQRRAKARDSLLMQFSAFSLPVQTQNVYRILLTIPLGAFLVAFLRNIIGVKTFGTFMPILIALSFRETQLLWGIVLFTMIIGLGLAIRFLLDRFRLLLVPRLSSVLIIVMILMLMISIISHQLGLDRGLSIALFPMVILAMTIERMSIVWEEHGAMEAIMQGGGSMVVAAAGFLLMSDDLAAYLVFVFPELLLVVLAVTLLIGRYTGYRLSEFWRFRTLWLPGKKAS